MRTTSPVLFGALVISTLLATACTGPTNATTPPSPTPTTTSRTTTTSTTSVPLAPKVAHPLNASDAYLTESCKLLTPAQLSKLNLTDAIAEVREDYPGGPACNFDSHHTGSRALVQAPKAFPNGLDVLYQQHRKYPEGPHGYFIPTSVSGFPAVFQDSTDSREHGTCHLYVGVNDQHLFGVHYYSLLDNDETKLKDSCLLAKKTAEQVIATLQKNA